MYDISDTWETTARTAAHMILRYPDKISDGLEAELYALLEELDTEKAGQPRSTGTPDDAAGLRGMKDTSTIGRNLPQGGRMGT